MVWDPKPGDTTRPPKPPKTKNKIEKQDVPKAGSPVPTLSIATF
jgi:hypothetical protein